MDLTSWTYLLGGVGVFAAISAFAFDRFRPGTHGATNAYKAVALTFVGLFITLGINLAGRLLRQHYGITIHDDWFWPLRWWPTVAGAWYFALHHWAKLLGKTNAP